MKILGRVLTFTITLVLLSFPVLVWFKAQALVDWWALKDYTPPARIAQLATDGSMTEEARRIFYVNHPVLIVDANEFQEKCPQSEQTIVLGCYRSNQDGITIRDINEPRLAGIHEVTAAHEMLHAVYDRLNNKQKSAINSELKKYYENELKDERILETIRTYEGLDSNELLNEMHSVFGTEAISLPEKLEQHYKKYFNIRQQVTDLAANYSKEFSSRTKAIEEYKKQIDDLKSKVEDQQKSLEVQGEKIAADRKRLDSLRSEGQFDEYNNGVMSFNDQIDAYNGSINRLRRDISTLNKLVEEHNAIVGELSTLEKAIDSRTIPQGL